MRFLQIVLCLLVASLMVSAQDPLEIYTPLSAGHPMKASLVNSDLVIEFYRGSGAACNAVILVQGDWKDAEYGVLNFSEHPNELLFDAQPKEVEVIGVFMQNSEWIDDAPDRQLLEYQNSKLISYDFFESSNDTLRIVIRSSDISEELMERIETGCVVALVSDYLDSVYAIPITAQR